MNRSVEISNKKNELSQNYDSRAANFEAQAIESAAKATRFALLRLAYFILAIALLIFIFSKNTLFCVFASIIALIIFGYMVHHHLKIQAQTNFFKAMEKVNRRELDIMDRKMEGLPDGNHFLDVQHPYALDLDLFGPYSFFQFYNRGQTALGQKAFADYLLSPAKPPEILLRQEAIKELSEDLNWRQEYLALGTQQTENDQHLALLNNWLKSENYVKPVSWIPLVFFIVPIIFILGIYICTTFLPFLFILFFWAIPLLILRKFVIRINETHRLTTKAGEVLKGYAKLIKVIEDQSFQSTHLKKLQSKFDSKSEQASVVVKKLSYIISQLEVRNNPFCIILNVIGLWELYWIYRLELWKEKYQAEVKPWFDAFGEFETLISFAGIHYNQPHWVFPDIINNGDFSATNLAHPLIAQEEVVGNDLTIPAHAHLKLLTGSNMAGKSTFLRTVGLNIVMGLAGAPVAAIKMQLPQLDVFTSMRTQDALHESTSSFYAELKRLKMILGAVEKHNTTGEGLQPFFLLDEILKGTNSVDRHTGSKALIEQLIDEKAAGIIATHDLELGELEKTANGVIENLCIEVGVKDGKLVFDYKLQKGVSKSFNATQLMREMGIKNL